MAINAESNRLGLYGLNDVFERYYPSELKPFGPAVDTGNNEYIIAAGITSDISGSVRILDGTVDLGAREYKYGIGKYPPSSPGNLEASVHSNGSIHISWWGDSSPGNTAGFVLLRSTKDESPWAIVYSGPEADFFDTNISPGTRYFYRAYAVNAEGIQSGLSNFGSATAPGNAQNVDLVPFAPENWSSPMVITHQWNGTTDDAEFNSDGYIYLNWNIKNIGTTFQNIPFDVHLYLDGKLFRTWAFGATPGNNQSFGITNENIGQLSGGTHTFEFRIDPFGYLTETDTVNNVYTKTITIAKPLPDFGPSVRDGFADSLFVTNAHGMLSIPEKLYSSDHLYYNWMFDNYGECGVEPFSVEVYCDGQRILESRYEGGNYLYWYRIDIPLGYFDPGEHTLELRIDIYNEVAEFDETNNIITRTFYIEPSVDLAPAPVEPGSAPIIVLANSPNEILWQNRHFEILWSIENVGREYNKTPFEVAIYVDGNLHSTREFVEWRISPRGSLGELEHFPQGLSPGEHTIEIRIDPNNTLLEADETNNIFSITVYVEPIIVAEDLEFEFIENNTIEFSWSWLDMPYISYEQRVSGTNSWSSLGQAACEHSGTWSFFASMYYGLSSDYRVAAYVPSAGTFYSEILTAITLPSPVAPLPESFTATVLNRNEVSLQWTSETPYGLQYFLQRAESGTDNWNQISQLYSHEGQYEFVDWRPDVTKSYDYRLASRVYGGDTAVSETITAETIAPPRDIAFTQPSGWNGPIVITCESGAEELVAGDSFKINIAFTNHGTPLADAIDVGVYLDGELLFMTHRGPGLPLSGYWEVPYSLGKLAEGNHTLEVVLDDGDAIYEASEWNNFLTLNFTIAAAPPVATPLAVPAGLDVFVRGMNQIEIEWDAVENASAYQLQQYNGRIWTTIYTGPATNFISSGLSANSTYQYRVAAMNAGETTAYSGTVSGTTQKNKTANVPSNLALVANTTTSVTVTWADNSSDETGFIVQWSSDGKTWKSATTAANVSSYTISALNSDTEYSVRVQSTNKFGQSAFSRTLAASTEALAPPTVPVAPANFVANSVTQNSAELSWVVPANAANTSVQRAESAGGPWTTVAVLNTPAGSGTSIAMN